MFGWLRSKPTCAIDAATCAWLDHRWAWLENESGVERLRGRQVILPRPEVLPDPYHGEEAVSSAVCPACAPGGNSRR